MTAKTRHYLEAFRRIGLEMAAPLARAGLECHVGNWLDSAVLKLTKPGWGGRGPVPGGTAAAIFFGIWVEERAKVENRVYYNIHALRLRALKTHTLESREFAEAFRREFKADPRRWPNGSTDHGPRTLMQGWVDVPGPEGDLTPVVALVKQFIPVAPTIDRLLAERRSG